MISPLRTSRGLGDLLRTLTDKEKRYWSNFLPLLQLAYNARFHATLGMSPFACLTGRRPNLPLDVCIEVTQQTQEWTYNNTVAHFQKIVREVFLNKQKKIQLRAPMWKNHKNKLKPGLVCWFYHQTNPLAGNKRQSVFIGPYRLLQRIGSVIWLIEPVLVHGKPIAAHESRLFPCRKNIEPGQTHIGNLDMDQDDMELLQEEVEQVSNDNPDITQQLQIQQLAKNRIEIETAENSEDVEDLEGLGDTVREHNTETQNLESRQEAPQVGRPCNESSTVAQDISQLPPTDHNVEIQHLTNAIGAVDISPPTENLTHSRSQTNQDGDNLESQA